MYILSTSCSSYPDSWTNYVVDIPLNTATLLSDEKFLEEYNYLFDEGITGYRIELADEKADTWKMVVQYIDLAGDFEETELFLYRMNFVNGEGVHRGE